ERRTLRLAARYADAANVFGAAETVRRKAQVLRDHCRAAGRQPDCVALTHLSTVVIGADDVHLRDLVETLRPRRQAPAEYAVTANAGTVEDHVGRCRELADCGVPEVMMSLPNLYAGGLEQAAEVIAAFR